MGFVPSPRMRTLFLFSTDTMLAAFFAGVDLSPPLPSGEGGCCDEYSLLLMLEMGKQGSGRGRAGTVYHQEAEIW